MYPSLAYEGLDSCMHEVSNHDTRHSRRRASRFNPNALPTVVLCCPTQHSASFIPAYSISCSTAWICGRSMLGTPRQAAVLSVIRISRLRDTEVAY